MHERIRDIALGRWGWTVASRPGWTLAICLVIAAGAVVLTVLKLEFRSDRSELIDPNLGWNRLYANYRSRYDRWDDLIVCLDGPPEDERVDRLARTIADRLRSAPIVVAADAGFEALSSGPRLYLTAPPEKFEAALNELAAARTIAHAPGAVSALGGLVGQLRGQSAPGPETLDALEALLEPYFAAMEGTAPDFGFLAPDAARWTPFVSGGGGGRLRFVQVQMKEPTGGIDEVSANLLWLREEVAALTAGTGGVEWGVTGIPAIEADETRQSIRDSTIASIIAFVLITGLMLVVFRGVVVPLLAAGALLVGMAWSFGWLVLAVGHLQLLSVVFSVILLGLGIDFALHLVARLELVQDEHEALPEAMKRVFRGIGPGMVTGAITTAAAFGMTALTKFKGMAEMGIIAGGGIILCLVAVLCVFPAALGMTGRWKKIIRHRPGGEMARFAHGRFDMVDFHPRLTLWAGALVAAGMLWPALQVRYDPNILNLQPPGIESVEWERRIVEDDAGSVWSAIIETEPAAASALVERLRRSAQVSSVGAMALLFPPDLDERLAQVAAVQMRPDPVPAPPGPDGLRDEVVAIRLGLAAARRTAAPDVARRLQTLDSRLATALLAFADTDAGTRNMCVERLADAFGAVQTPLRAWVDAALTAVPPTPDDLPAVLRDRWVKDGRWLLHVHPRVDPAGRSVLHPDRLEAFVTALQRIHPTVLGPPVQIYESSRLIQREYIKAAGLAIAAILVLLLLDFRSLSDALCAMLPVIVGFVGAFAIMGTLGVPLNFANIIVMPLIFGIGVDAGVHIVHRWRSEPWGRPAGLSGGTGRGVTVTMLTTMIGFGAMLVAEHRGIRSLGLVMVAGLGVTLVACTTLLPALLRLRTEHWVHQSESPILPSSPHPRHNNQSGSGD